MSLPDAVFVFSANGKIADCNDAAAALVGRARSELIGENRDFVQPVERPEGWFASVLAGNTAKFETSFSSKDHQSLGVSVSASTIRDAAGKVTHVTVIARRAEDRHMVVEKYRKAIDHGETFDFQLRVLRPDGEVRFVASSGAPVIDGEGTVTALQGIFQDISERIEVEDRLHTRDRTNRILREAIDSVKEAVSVYDDFGKLVFVNEAFYQLYPYFRNSPHLLGMTFEEIIREGINEGHLPIPAAFDDPEKYIQSRVEDLSKPTSIGEREYSDGRWFLIRDAESDSGYKITSRIDITEQKQAQLSYQTSSTVLQATLDTIPNALIAFDRENRLIAWNAAFAEMVGLDPALLVRGRSLPSLTRLALKHTPETVRGIKPVFAAISNNQPFELEWVRNDGETYIVTGNKMADGGVLTVFRNITAERQARAQSEALELRLQEAIRAMNDGFALFDGEGKLVMSNETYQEMYSHFGDFVRVGWTFEEMVRAGVAAGQFPDAERASDSWIADRLRAFWEPGDHAIEERLEDGRVLLVRDFRTRDGGVVCIRSDITERIRTESELRSARDELEDQAKSLRDLADEIDGARRKAEEGDAAKSRFLAMMSHELRTPMTGLLGMIELMSRSELNQDQRGFLGTMRDSAETLLSLLNDILDFSKLEAGKVVMEEIDFNLQDLVQTVVQLFQTPASSKGLRLDSTISEALPSHVRGDPLRIKQILSNLVSNAIKFTEFGSVTISLSLGDRPEDARGGLELVGRVQDTGLGMEEHVRKNLFQAFEQGETSTSRRFGGTGLGLAICKRLSEVMGGGIDVESEPGAGSAFTFRVRVQEAEAPVPQPVEEESSGDEAIQPRSILLAEDNDINRMLIASVLSQSGHKVTEAVNGREALRCLQKDRFDVVLMDMQMPVMDGSEATRWIRAMDEPLNAIPILALTADALPEHRELYFGAGVDDILTKPVDWEQLEVAIAKFTRTRGVEDEGNQSMGGATTSNSAVPVFDMDRVMAGLGVLPAARAAAMMGMLPDEIHNRLKELNEAVDGDDIESVKMVAHTLKGLAANFGAARLEAAARAVESCTSIAAAHDAVSIVSETVRETATDVARVVKELESRGD